MYERLDRVLCNAEWRDLFSDASVFNLPRVKSDYHPNLLKTRGEKRDNNSRFPFHFEFAWTTHPSFNEFIKSKWEGRDNIDCKIRDLSKSLRKWNADVFGDIFKRKKMTIAQLEGI